MIHKVVATCVVISAGWVAACSSSPTKDERSASPSEASSAQASKSEAKNSNSEPKLGSTARAQGSTEVQGKRQVLRTETVKRSVPSLRETRVKADINRMDVDDFVVMGLTRQAAESVIQQRQERGRFKSVDELAGVPGVAREWFSSVRQKLGAG